MSRAEPIIVFDGVCVMCSAWVRFLLKREAAAKYRFAAMQGATGRRLLAENGLDPDDPVSMLLVEGDGVSSDTDAILRIVAGLGGAYRLVALARLVPRPIRNPLYRVLARNRYRWFGRHDRCMVPTAEDSARFLP